MQEGGVFKKILPPALGMATVAPLFHSHAGGGSWCLPSSDEETELGWYISPQLACGLPFFFWLHFLDSDACKAVRTWAKALIFLSLLS